MSDNVKSSPPADRSHDLGHRAFILSLLVIIPVAPLIGVIMGIAGASALRGKPGRRLAIAAIPTGLVMTALMIVVGGSALLGNLRRHYVGLEARDGLKTIRESIGSYAKRRARSPNETASLISQGDTGWTPAKPCCRNPGPRCGPNKAWSAPPWGTLGFRMTDYHTYQWRYRGRGNRFIVEARGDRDCDGVMAHYRMAGTVDHHGQPKTATVVSNWDE